MFNPKFLLYGLLFQVVLSLWTGLNLNNDKLLETNEKDDYLSKDSTIVSNFDEVSKRPYFSNETYFTNQEEVSLIRYNFVRDQDNKPALVALFKYKNVSETTQIPAHVKLFFSFEQDGKEIKETQVAMTENFLELYPTYASGFDNFRSKVEPGEETEFIVSVPLKNTEEVVLKVEEKISSNPKDIYLYFTN